MCISYLLLRNKLPQSLEAKNNSKHLSSHTNVGQESECFWLGVSYKTIIKILGKAVSIWRLDWSGKICFQDGLLTQLADGHWLGAGGLSSPRRSILTTHNNQLPLEQMIQENTAKTQHLLWPSLGSHTSSRVHYPIGYTAQSTHCGRGQDKGLNTKRPGWLGANLTGWLPQDRVYEVKKGTAS